MIRYGQGPGKRHQVQVPRGNRSHPAFPWGHDGRLPPARNGYGFAGYWSMSPLDVMFNGTNGDPSRRKENSPGNPSTRRWESSAASPPRRSEDRSPQRTRLASECWTDFPFATSWGNAHGQERPERHSPPNPRRRKVKLHPRTLW